MNRAAVLAQVAPDAGVSVTQLITGASIALTVLMLGFSLYKGRNRSRLRPMLDVARVIIQSAVAVAIPAITAVTTSPVLILLPALGGLVLGILQGRALEIEVDTDRIYAKRNIVGFAIWSFGLVLMQGAGLANRVGVLQVGQAITWFSIGITVGLILGRHDRVNRALTSAVTGVTPILLIIVILLGGCVDAAELNVSVEPDGSGVFEIGLGVFLDPDGDTEPCDFDGGIGYQEIRNGMQWCYAGLPFGNIEGLRALLLSFNEEGEIFRVNCLALQDGRALLDLDIVLEPDDASSAEDVLPISVRVPGVIDSSNGTVSGNTVTWVLTGASAGSVFSMRINIDDQGRCPTAGVGLTLTANADGSGAAILSMPVLPTGEEDNQVLVDAIAASGWVVTPPSSQDASTFSAGSSWDDPSSFAQAIEALPFLSGSRFALDVEPAFAEMSFDGFLDLSGYDVFFTGIDPELATPGFTLGYIAEGAISSTTGDWSDPGALTFNWASPSDGLLFGLTATTTTDPAAVQAASDEAAAEAQRRADEDAAGAESGQGGDDGSEEESGGVPGALPDAGAESGADGSNDAATDVSDLPDSEDVTENEALNAAVAGLLAAAAAGIITWAEAAEAIGRLTEAADANAAERATAKAEAERQAAEAAEAERQRLIELHRQTFDRMVEALPHGIPFEEWDAEIDAIRDRVNAGTATEADIARMTEIRDRARSVYLDADAERLATHETSDTILAAGEWAAWGGTIAAKTAAGALGGPVAGGIVTGLVDGAGASHLGWDKAVATGVANGIVDGVTGGLLADLNRFGLTERVGKAALANGVAASAQNYWGQLVANGGDASKVDMSQVQNAGFLGMGIGGITGAATSRVPDTPTVSGVRPTPFGGDDIGHGWGQRVTPSVDDVRPTSFGDDATGRGWGQHTGSPEAPTGQRPPDPEAPTGPTSTPEAPTGQRPPEAPTGPTSTPEVPTGQRPPDPEAPTGQRPPDPEAPTGVNPAAAAEPVVAPDADGGVPRQPGPSGTRAVDLGEPAPRPPAVDQRAPSDPVTQRALEGLDHQPADLSPPSPQGGGGSAQTLLETDPQGRVWVGNRHIADVRPDGTMVDLDGNNVRGAYDSHTGRLTGIVETPPPGPAGTQPVYNSRGELAGHVTAQGHRVDADGNFTWTASGDPARAALDADGNLVSFEGPLPREVTSPSDGFAVQDLDGTRVPVLDGNGQPIHTIEPGPRVIQYDENGVPNAVQRQLPLTSEDPRMPGRLNPENMMATQSQVPLSGADAPPVALSQRVDASGRAPNAWNQTHWDGYGAGEGGRLTAPDGSTPAQIDADLRGSTADGIPIGGTLYETVPGSTPSGAGTMFGRPVGKMGPDGVIYDIDTGLPREITPDTQFRPDIRVNNGRIVGYTTAAGKTVDLD